MDDDGHFPAVRNLNFGQVSHRWRRSVVVKVYMKTYDFLLVMIALALACSLGGCKGDSALPAASPAESTGAPAASYSMIDDFEAGGTSWKAGLPPEYSDSSAQTVALSSENPMQGKRSLELSFTKNELPKAIFLVEKPLNLNRERYLEFEVENNGSALGAAIAICTGANWEWFESAAVPLDEGVQTVSFDLAANTFKSAASGWKFSTGIANRDQVKRLVIIIYPSAAGSVRVDALRLADSASGKEPQVTAQPSPTPLSTRDASFLALKILKEPQQAYELLELQVETDGIYRNPFDAAEVDLQARILAPNGKVYSIPAFWYQDYDQTMLAQGAPGWRVRFTPWEAGEWTIQAVLGSLTSDALKVEVAEAIGRGFLRLHPQNPAYFAFEDGMTYFPIGINMGWGSSRPLLDYERWLDRLSANGGNFIRVWMASWSFGLEWSDTGLGDYTRRLDRAWQLDQVFRLAEERGVLIELVLINHGAFSQTVNPEWDANPYNAANGGPCQKPQDFASDPLARQLFQRRLRYIAARWAYSPALMAWEWWNEADWTPISNRDHVAWIQEMTPVLRQYDPYRHLISTSFARGSTPQVNGIPEIEFSQIHLYDSSDPATNFPELYRDWSRDLPGKPILFAEFGASAAGEDTRSEDRRGLHLHNGLWAATFSGFASGAMYWWWDSYVDPLNLWGLYGNLSRFLEGEDIAALQPARGVISWRELPYRILMNPQRALIWFHDRKFEIGALSRARALLQLQGKPAGDDWTYLPDAISGVTLKVTGLQDGAYRVYWYAPFQGQWLSQQALEVVDGEATLQLPTFQGDLAAKVLPADLTGPETP